MLEPELRSGRRSDATRNDARVVESARTVLAADPHATMTQIAHHAGVGMGTVYRHYPSKEMLVRQLCLDGLERIAIHVRNAIADCEQDPATAFEDFMRNALAAGRGAFARLAGTFTMSADLLAAACEVEQLIDRLLHYCQATGAVRTDVTATDLDLLLQQIHAVHVADDHRIGNLQRRYLELTLQALCRPNPEPLPGPGATANDVHPLWT